MIRLKDTSLEDIIRAHKTARRADDELGMQYIEDSLTDINYHTIRDLMHDGEYIKAVEQHRTAGLKIEV